jgi:hypothetical protein
MGPQCVYWLHTALMAPMAPTFLKNLCIPDLMLKEVKPNSHNSESLSSPFFPVLAKLRKAIISSVTAVCLSVDMKKKLVSCGTDFH